MKRSRVYFSGLFSLFSVLFAGFLWQTPTAWASTEEKFDVLQIGTHAYHNVTVTTKSKDYVFILHSDGMTNVKVGELSPEVREKLGYVDPQKAQVQTNNAAAAWAKQTFAKLDNTRLKGMETQVINTWRAQISKANVTLPPVTPKLLAIVLGVTLGLYLFYCYCCMLICQKTGQEPSVLVWLPLLQIFPLLRAAGMSGWWFFLYLLPGLNLLAHIVWCVKITNARAKGVLVAIFLILPPSSFLAFLYLAFSNGGGSKRETRRMGPIMTLETA